MRLIASVLFHTKQKYPTDRQTVFADYGKLSRHEEYIIHHARPRGQKSVRLHRQGRKNGETLLPRVQGGNHCKSITITPFSDRQEREMSVERAWSVREVSVTGKSLAMTGSSLFPLHLIGASPLAPLKTLRNGCRLATNYVFEN